MLTLDDCFALSDLTVEEVAAIAAHDQCPEIVAAELGRYLAETVTGQIHIKDSSACRIQAIIIVWPEGGGRYEQEFA